jgi:hypothetical protein
MAPQIYPVTLLDSNQVIQYVYDEATQSLRTTATATIVGGDITVDIDGIYAFLGNPDPDNIGLIGHIRAVSPGDSDQTNRITSITNGTIHALDVAIHNSDGTPIDNSNPMVVDSGTTATTPITYNVLAPVAGTEYSQVIPVGTKRFMAKVRSGDAKTQFAYVSGQSGTNYTTIRAGVFYEEINLNLTAPITFYFQTNLAGQVLEMLVWT